MCTIKVSVFFNAETLVIQDHLTFARRDAVAIQFEISVVNPPAVQHNS